MIIWGSSRRGRKGEVVTNWVKHQVTADGRFEIDYVDLQEQKLPFFDEPQSPFDMDSLDDYTHPESKAWAQRVATSEAYLFITPEYNRSIPGVLKNAIDTVGKPWINKPAGIISYGGLSGGMVATAHLRLIAVELGLIQVAKWIAFPYFKEAFDQNGRPLKADYYEANFKKLLNELIRLHQAFHKADQN